MLNNELELAGLIDLHVHAGPDVRPRKQSALELAQAARAAGMRGLLFKNHHAPTAIAAGLLAEAVPGLVVFGGLALNESVGGLNPAAVEAALQMGARQIWLPTLDAAHERAFRGRPGTGLSVLTPDGKLRAEAQEILRLVVAQDCILGLGHLSFDEMEAIIKAARSAGAVKLLVNHPEITFLNLSIAEQRSLLGDGVYFERCYVRANQTVDWDGLAAVIRATGVACNVLATDLGQPDHPDPVTGLREMLRELRQRGFTTTELQTMACHNPARLLNL